ncbi:MAG TPA: hypothetical protein VF588_13450 [Pyrinomonadaceae bacterium]
MITGFNTDVPYDGVTYHVQTEDKGLETPLILSLVYVGGAIIAAKRTPYEDLLSKGFDEQALTERLQRQHKLICAAIKSGRVEELKRMSGANGGAAGPEAQTAGAAPSAKKPGGQRRKKAEPSAGEPAAPEELIVPTAGRPESLPAEVAAAAPVAPVASTVAEPAAREKAEPVAREKSEPEVVILSSLADEIVAFEDFIPPPAPVRPAPPEPRAETPANEAAPPAPVLTAEALEPPSQTTDELYLTLLDDEGEFRAGQLATVKVYVGRGSYGQKPETEASVTVKVLGTSFRPLILTTETDAQGVGVVRALLPRFTSGRAAIIIRAVAGEDSAEMRRIIHQ